MHQSFTPLEEIHMSRLNAALERYSVQLNGTRSPHPPLTIHCFETVSSTNSVVWNLIDDGACSDTVVIASQQTTGKGQWGRRWQSSEGGLYLSVAIALNCPVDQGRELSLVSGWGIASALRQHNIPVCVKWPNDLILQGRKLGGILIETRMHQERITWAVIGVGINWTNPVPDVGITLRSFLDQHANAPILSIEDLAAVVLHGIMASYHNWHRHGISNLLPSYQSLLTHLGHPIHIQGQQGHIVGVSPQGNLRISITNSDTPSATEISVEPGTISLGYSSLSNYG
ncbi:MAG: biotin--[acetyl-CoA-carboxylase] ligase [Elainellaceae cyanobacterium]